MEKNLKMENLTEVYRVQTKKLARNEVAIRSKQGKIIYAVTDKEIFNRPEYSKIIETLDSIETKLKGNLSFNVKLNHSVLMAFKKFFDDKEDEIDYFKQKKQYSASKHLDASQVLKETISIHIFEFLNDIENLQLQTIYDKYLDGAVLKRLYTFYEEYSDIVLAQFENGYTSLFLFEMISNEYKPSALLTTICDAIKKKGSSQVEACNLFIKYMNEISSGHLKERNLNNMASEVKSLSARLASASN